MNLYSDKTKKSTIKAASTIQKKTDKEKSVFQFVDNRSEASAQRKIVSLMNKFANRNQSPIQKKDININDDSDLEKEADEMGVQALQMKKSNHTRLKNGNNSEEVAQLIPWGKIIAGGIVGGLTGLAAYYYYKKQQQEQQALQDQQNKDNAYQEILNEQMGQPIANGGVQHTQGSRAFSHTVATNGTGNLPQGQRMYHVEVNNDDPVGLGRNDPELIRTAEIHERTHLSVDQSYTSNANHADQAIGHDLGGNLGAHLNEQWERRDERLNGLVAIVNQDQGLTDQQREDILQRVGNARMQIEYDPTINELLAYTHEYNMNASLPTVRALVLLANESRAHRADPNSQLQGNWPV